MVAFIKIPPILVDKGNIWGQVMKPRSRRKTKSGYREWLGPSFGAITTVVATVAIIAPARAAVLQDWAFDPNTRQLTLTLPEGITPDYFLLAEPARIVLELPGMTLGNVAAEQQYSGAVSSIRTSEVPGGSRIVVELAPNTLLDRRHAELTAIAAGNGQTRWTLLPLIQDGEPAAPVATEPASQFPSPAANADAGQPSTAIPEPVVTEAIPQLPPTPIVMVEPEVAEPDMAELEVIEPDLVEEPDEIELEVIEPDMAEPDMVEPDEIEPEASAAISNSDRSATVPEVTQAMTAGTAQALSDASESLPGVRTDAAALAGVGSEAESELLPDRLSPDPFETAVEPTISVPSLEPGPSVSVPQVSVPPLATVPEVSPTPELTTVPSVEAAVGNPLPPVPDSALANEAIAITPAIPTAPTPPPSSSNTATTVTAPPVPLPPETQVEAAPPAIPRQPPAIPPQPEAIASEPNTVTPEVAIPPSLETSTPAAVPEDDPVEVAPPPSPPFLAGTGTPPRVVEQPSIPPPPPIPSDSSPVPFGTPLPAQIKSTEGASMPAMVEETEAIPVGTRLVLQYPGTEPLLLEQQDPWYEVLLVAEDVLHPETDALLLAAGTPIIGRFEGFDESGRRFVTQFFIAESDRHPLLAESDWLLGVSQPNGSNVLVNSGVGAVAVTVLSSFSGVGLIGGAALGAASTITGTPRLVSIQPGQLIEVEVVSDILPFNDAPNINQPLSPIP